MEGEGEIARDSMRVYTCTHTQYSFMYNIHTYIFHNYKYTHNVFQS